MDNNLEETIGAKEAEITGEIFLLISFLLAPFAGFISILCYGLSRLLLDQLKATLLLFFTGVIMIISLTFSIRFPNFKDFPILKAIQDYLLF
ncbi:mob protein, partial [Streptococcus mutans]|nr:mob protein [Streptococcus mutans]